MKPLAFDSPSNTSSLKFFFKSSVSYQCLQPQNPFILYMSTTQLLLTNFKDAAFSSQPSIQCCFVMVRCFENYGVVCQIQRPCIQTILRQSHYTKESKALIRMTECNTTMKWLLSNANVTTKFQNTAIPRSFTAKISSVIFLSVCFKR